MCIVTLQKEREHALSKLVKYGTFISMWGLNERTYLVQWSHLKGLVAIEKSLGSSDLGRSCR